MAAAPLPAVTRTCVTFDGTWSVALALAAAAEVLEKIEEPWATRSPLQVMPAPLVVVIPALEVMLPKPALMRPAAKSRMAERRVQNTRGQRERLNAQRSTNLRHAPGQEGREGMGRTRRS